MRNVFIVVFIVFMSMLLFGCVSSNESMSHHDNHDHSDSSSDSDASMHGFLKTYGPGLSPHLHTRDMSKVVKVQDIAKDPNDLPLPLTRTNEDTVKINLHAIEVISELAPGITYEFWTFGGTVPGPLLRVREGDTVELTLSNDKTSMHNHSIDLHAVTGPGGGSGFTQVAPGESKTIRFKALNPGSYVYHCATHNIPTHVANGMYGMIIVEPKEGFAEVDKEFYAMQGEIYTKGSLGQKGHQEFDPNKMVSEKPDYVVFNGRIGALIDKPLNANSGDKVRMFIGNGGVSLTSSFHVIGEIFDNVYHEGATSIPHNNIQTTTIPAGGASVVEFEVDVPGTYILVDHALSRLEKGAWGLMHVAGEKRDDIYTQVR